MLANRADRDQTVPEKKQSDRGILCSDWLSNYHTQENSNSAEGTVLPLVIVTFYVTSHFCLSKGKQKLVLIHFGIQCNI